ncbi:MAG: hypothetical protein K2X38_04295 [Gemmataceae bacterium]|nr:hypothetical protein [Gemmataceae bacterium]
MRRWMLTSFAAGLCALGLGTNVRAADDVMRLDGKGEDAETLEARGGHGGFGGGHGGGYGGGHGRYYGGGGFHGRGYYGGGFNHGYHGGGFNHGYYGGGFYYRYPTYYSSPVYHSTPVYSSPVYYSSQVYYTPCATAPAATVTLGAVSTPLTNDVTVLSPTRNIVPKPRTIPQNEQAPNTFPYDGGAPRVPLPSDAAPMSSPQRSTLPLEGKLVSLTPSNNSYTYRAFGENMLTPAPARDTLLVSNTAAADTFRMSMPTQTTGGTTSLR